MGGENAYIRKAHRLSREVLGDTHGFVLQNTTRKVSMWVFILQFYKSTFRVIIRSSYLVLLICIKKTALHQVVLEWKFSSL